MSKKDYDRNFYDTGKAKSGKIFGILAIIFVVLFLMNVYSQSVYGVSIVEVINKYIGR